LTAVAAARLDLLRAGCQAAHSLHRHHLQHPLLLPLLHYQQPVAAPAGCLAASRGHSQPFLCCCQLLHLLYMWQPHLLLLLLLGVFCELCAAYKQLLLLQLQPQLLLLLLVWHQPVGKAVASVEEDCCLSAAAAAAA
jgi:hypothetical protein